MIDAVAMKSKQTIIPAKLQPKVLYHPHSNHMGTEKLGFWHKNQCTASTSMMTQQTPYSSVSQAWNASRSNLRTKYTQ